MVTFFISKARTLCRGNSLARKHRTAPHRTAPYQSQFKLEMSGIEPEVSKCKFGVLPIKLHSLLYPKNDSNVHGY